MTLELEAEPCRGCGGSGVAHFTPAPPAAPYDYCCPACNGKGHEPKVGGDE